MSGTTIGQEDSAYSRRLAESFFGIFSRLSPGCIPKKILEVGCQRGYLLHEFQQRGVERAIGVEPGDIEPWIDENGGIVDIRRGYLSRDIVGEDDFDFVFSLSVFEHVEKPKEFLQIIHDLLRPGGRLLVAVPNEVFSLQAGNIGMFLFQHLNYFTPELLKTIFATCGFHVTGIISSRELPLYVIAEKGGAKEGSGIDADVKAKTRRLLTGYKERVEEKLNFIRGISDELKDSPLGFYGVEGSANIFSWIPRLLDRPCAIFDSDSHKWSKRFSGIPSVVKPPDELCTVNDVIPAPYRLQEEIIRFLYGQRHPVQVHRLY